MMVDLDTVAEIFNSTNSATRRLNILHTMLESVKAAAFEDGKIVGENIATKSDYQKGDEKSALEAMACMIGTGHKYRGFAIPCIKAIRDFTGMGLKESKQAYDKFFCSMDD